MPEKTQKRPRLALARKSAGILILNLRSTALLMGVLRPLRMLAVRQLTASRRPGLRSSGRKSWTNSRTSSLRKQRSKKTTTT